MSTVLPGLDRFHLCSLYAARIAMAEGRLEDSEYVRQMTYRMYEGGAFKDEKLENQEESSMTNQPPNSEAA